MARRRGLSFYRRRKNVGMTIVREIFVYTFIVVLAIFLAVVLTYFFGMSTKVVGISMEPVLYSGQTIYIDRFSYILSQPDAGDVVVFLPRGNENTHYYVKRVIAEPGDRVEIRDGVCYVNGEETPYIQEKILDAGIAVNEIVLKSGTYFCIGVNPNNSEDSRSANIGPVEEKDIIGKAWFHLGSEDTGIGFIK